jgi:2-polyprenyl-3-methyl-5-hydroxy-6-metoxy-1,4-benzoquinol methylase
MRDLRDYQDKYLDNNPYEKYQVKYRREPILNFIDQHKPKQILEIGCGEDSLFNYVANFERFVVVEPGDVFVAKATQAKGKHSLADKIQIVQEPFEGSNDRVKDFDFVICSGLLHELTNQRQFMDQLFSLSNHETIVHVSVPNANSFHRELAVKSGLIDSVHQKSDFQVKFQQHNVFSMKQLEDLAASVGFEVIEKATFSLKPFTHIQMQRLIDDKIIDDRIVDALANMTYLLPEMGSEMYVNLKKK